MNHLNDLPKIHPREAIVKKARLVLGDALLKLMREHDLTDAEFISVVAGELGDTVTRRTKYMIRDERHGDQNKPGGFAPDGPTENHWRCPDCDFSYPGSPDNETDAGTLSGLSCMCPSENRDANLPNHGTKENPCEDADCSHCGWKGTMP